MVCKTTSTKRKTAAFTVLEMVVTTSIGMFLIAVVLSLYFFSARSFASLTNYLDLDQQTQVALDKMSREIRQVNKLSSFSSTSLTFVDWDGADLKYTFDPRAQTLKRVKGGVETTLLTGCDSLAFSIFQRSPNGSTFEPVSTATVTDTKVIELTWNCSRKILGSAVNNESMQSAKVVIRNK